MFHILEIIGNKRGEKYVAGSILLIHESTFIFFCFTLRREASFADMFLLSGPIGIVEVGINSSLVSSKKMSYISLQEINKISPKDNSDALFNVTYTDAEDINRRITVKEIVYDSDTTYIEKARKTFLFLYRRCSLV